MKTIPGYKSIYIKSSIILFIQAIACHK